IFVPGHFGGPSSRRWELAHILEQALLCSQDGAVVARPNQQASVMPWQGSLLDDLVDIPLPIIDIHPRVLRIGLGQLLDTAEALEATEGLLLADMSVVTIPWLATIKVFQ